MRVSKTRFRSQDGSKEARSVSSPRLKSFPAEKIKRLNDPPAFSPEPIGALIMQQDPRETGTFFVGCPVGGNNDRGDAIATQLSPVHQQPNPCAQNASSMSQQQVAAAYQQIDRANPQSESSPPRWIASPEGQARRPFVPNAFQATAIRERSPRNSPTTIDQPVIIQAPPMRGCNVTPRTRQPSGDSHAIVDRDRKIEDSALNAAYDNPPIGDRDAANRKQMQAQHQMQARAANAPLNDRSMNNCQIVRLQGVHNTAPHGPFRQMPPQTCQQSQHNAYRQQVPQQTSDRAQPMSNQQQQSMHNSATAEFHRSCDCCNQRFLSALFPGQGMTSPQDMTMSQMRLTRHTNLPVHQRNLGYSVDLQPCQSATWPQNDRWMQATSHDQQQHSHQQHSSSRYHRPAQATQSSDFNRQSSGGQGQSAPSRNQASCKSADQQPNAKAPGRLGGERKITPQFTPDMIRDQELLVATMRQQGIPDDVMRRQFDALLNEQRRHLAYVAQFQQQENSSPEAGRRTYQPAAGREAERDEKPEWMVHITPPWLSYSEAERMRARRRVPKDRCPTTDDEQPSEEVGRTMIPAQQEQDCRQRRKEETIDRSVPPQQAYFRMNVPHQLWQQRTADWSYRNDRQVTPCGHAGCYAHGHQQNAPHNVYRQPSQPFNEYNRHQSFPRPYPYNVPYDPYRAHSEQNVRPSERDATSSNRPIDDRRVTMDAPRFLQEQNGRWSVEPSSLLKIRMYKEMIRPQKRNNGLQDPDVIQKTLEALKDPTSRKGLEYLANLANRKPTVKLNGIQEPDEIPQDLRPRSPARITAPQIRRLVSANGLENTRNPGNPPPPRALRPKRADEAAMTEYPRQRQNPRTCYSVQAERENGTMAASHAHNAESIPYEDRRDEAATGIATFHQFGGNAPRYHQAQQYCLNGQNHLACHSGGQGDVASTQRPDAPGATRIDRAGGDTGENSAGTERTKRVAAGVPAMLGTNPHGRQHEARIVGCTGCPAGKADCARNDSLVVSPDKLIASRHLQPPMIF